MSGLKFYRQEIDGLRAIAITSVVLYHAFGGLFSGGYVGVDIFFVISGYLITSIIFEEAKENRFSFNNFYARRARRILPALLAMSLVTTIVATIVLIPNDLVEYGKILIYTQLFGANFRLAATPGYFDTSMQESPLLHMWSLSVEEQFYLVWPLLLFVMVRYLAPRRMLIVTIVLCLTSLMAAEVLVHIWPRSAFFHLPTRGWELLTGALLALKLFPKITSRGLAEMLSAIGVLFMLTAVWLYTRETPFPGFFAALPVFGCALVIYASSDYRTAVAKALSWRPVIFIGLISYSLYLWHWPILVFAKYIAVRPLTWGESVACVGLAVAISALSWRFVEQPFRRRSFAAVDLGAAAFRLLPGAAYTALALAVLLIASGSFFQELKGAPWRFSPGVQALFSQQPRAGLGGCTGREKENKNVVSCKFGDPDSNEVVLWGDSHAGAILPLVMQTYSSGRVYFTTSCSPLKNTSFLALFPGTAEQSCAEKNDHVMSEILRIKPRFLFLASRWDGLEKFASGPSRAEFEALFSRLINQTAEAGIEVVILRQVPKQKKETVPCMLRAKALGLTSCQDFVARADAERSQSHITGLIEEIARTNSNVFVFDPFPYFCDEARCYAMQKQKLAYFDADHLSIFGASALIEPFHRALPPEFRPDTQSAPSDISAKSKM